MKFNVHIPQKELLAINEALDIVDGTIFSWIESFGMSDRCIKLSSKEGTYFLISWKMIVDDLPMIRISTRTGIWKRINNLVDSKLLEPHPDNQRMSKSYYKLGENYEKVLRYPVNHGEQVFPTVNTPVNGGKHNYNTNTILTPTIPNGIVSPTEKSKILEERKSEFKKQVYEVGGLTYTREMLDDFLGYWSEPTQAKSPKMRWEKEKTWDLGGRLRTWQGRAKGYQTLLTEAQKTVKEKQRDFATQLKTFLGKKSPEFLNKFYQYWSQPDQQNRLRWEAQEFWDLAKRIEEFKG